MSWEINQLRKKLFKTYIPGEPGTPEVPGRSYEKKVLVKGGKIVTSTKPLPPSRATLVATIKKPFFNGNAYVFHNGPEFFGKQPITSSFVFGLGDRLDQDYSDRPFYVYKTKDYYKTEIVNLPGKQGTPPTPARVDIDYNEGWNSGAIGMGVVGPGDAVSWRLSPSSVGVAVGLSDRFTESGNRYRTMRIGILAMSGRYQVLVNGNPASSPVSFNANDSFAIFRDMDGGVRVIVSGVVVHEATLFGEYVADASLYHGNDVIWDAKLANIAELLPTATEEGDAIGASSISGAELLPDIQLAPGVIIPGVSTRFAVLMGPGGFVALPSPGLLSAATSSKAAVTAVVVNSVTTVTGSAYTRSSAECVGLRTPTFGPGTSVPFLGASTSSLGAVGHWSTSGGGANVGLSPLLASGVSQQLFETGNELLVGGTGHAPDYSVTIAPLEGGGDSGDIVPSVASGDCEMAPATMVGSGLTGGVSTAMDATFLPLDATATSEGSYSYAYVTVHPVLAYGADSGEPFIGSSAVLPLRFSLAATGSPANRGAAALVSRFPFSVSAHGSGAARGALGFALEATGHTENVGRLSGALRLALEASGEVGSYGRLQGAFKLAAVAHGSGRAAGSLPLFALQGQARTGAVGRLSAELGQLFALSASGVVGSVGRAELTLPGFSSVFTRLRGTLPLFSLRASGHVIEIPGEDGQLAYVVNVANGATSEYHNFPFINVARFRGETLLFGPAGAFRTGGDSDDGEAIAAVAELSPSDFETSLLKRMPYAYIGLQAEEGVRVTAVADEKEIVAALTSTTGRNRRAKLARGVKGRFWSLKIENTNGEHFAVDSVEYLPMLLRRKV